MSDELRRTNRITKKNLVLLAATLLGLGFFQAVLRLGLNAGLVTFGIICGLGAVPVLCALHGWHVAHMRLATLYMLIVTLSFFFYATVFPFEDFSLLGSHKNLEAYVTKPMPWYWGCLLLGAFLISLAPVFPPRRRGSWFGVVLAIVCMTVNAVSAIPIIDRSISMRDVTTYVVRPALNQLQMALHNYAKAHPHIGYPPQDVVHDYATLRNTLLVMDREKLKETDHQMGFQFQSYKTVDTDGDGQTEDYELTVALHCPSYATCHSLIAKMYTVTSSDIQW